MPLGFPGPHRTADWYLDAHDIHHEYLAEHSGNQLSPLVLVARGWLRVKEAVCAEIFVHALESSGQVQMAPGTAIPEAYLLRAAEDFSGHQSD